MLRGADAYKHGRYDEAIQHLEHAVALDPENTEARMYLATAYAQEYIPGVDKPANRQLAEKGSLSTTRFFASIPPTRRPSPARPICSFR